MLGTEVLVFHRCLAAKVLKQAAIIGPPAKLNGVSQAGRWWPNIEYRLGSFVILQIIQTSIVQKPYIFVIFQGRVGSGPPAPSPLCIRA